MISLLLKRNPSPPFAYNTMRESDFVSDPAAAFQNTWKAFRDEAATPDWIFRGVANLEFLNIESSGGGTFEEFSGPHASGVVRLTDDVLIVGRSEGALGPLGVTPSVMQRLRDEWGAGSGPFVMVVESSQAKSPDNLILAGDGQATTLATRILLAMRLVAPGHVGIGPMHLLRPARFNVGIGGDSRSVRPHSFVFGPAFELRPSLLPDIQRINGQLAAVSQRQGLAGPPRLLLALRYFDDDDRSVQSDAAVDLATCLEAVLGTDLEITFRLSMRVAQILASDDDERIRTFQDVKRWYGLRSKLVHGGGLKAQDQVLLNDLDPLRETVRRLLVGFLKLAVDNSPEYGANFFKGQAPPRHPPVSVEDSRTADRKWACTEAQTRPRCDAEAREVTACRNPTGINNSAQGEQGLWSAAGADPRHSGLLVDSREGRCLARLD